MAPYKVLNLSVISKRLWLEESGQGLIEYCFILAFISLGAIITLKSIGQSLIPKFNSAKEALQ